MINLEFKNTSEVLAAFPDDQTCIDHLEALRWNGNVSSPFNPFSKVYYCKANQYRCSCTSKYFNVKTGTMFYNTKIELRKWFAAIWIVTAEKSITSVQLSKDINVTQKTAWYMLQRITDYFPVEDPRTSANKKLSSLHSIQTDPAVYSNDTFDILEWLQLIKK